MNRIIAREPVLTDEPIWARMYGNELMNRPPEEWELEFIESHLATRRYLANKLIERSRLKLNMSTIFSSNTAAEVAVRNDDALTYAMASEISVTLEHLGHAEGYQRWGKKRHLISPGEWELRQEVTRLDRITRQLYASRKG